MFKLMNNKKGFTLVELMIVVVIMAILVAVAVPIYAAVTTNAQNKTCASNARVLAAQVNQIMMGTTTGDTALQSLRAAGETIKLDDDITTGGIRNASVTTGSKLSTMLQEGMPVCPFNGDGVANYYYAKSNGAVACSGWGQTGTMEKPDHPAA